MTYDDAVRRLSGRQWRVVPLAYPGCVRYVALIRKGDGATGVVARDAAGAVIALASSLAERHESEADNGGTQMSLKDALESASRQVEKSPDWLKTIYKRNDMLLEQRRRVYGAGEEGER